LFRKNAVTIDELVATIKKLKGASTQVKEEKLIEVLKTLDSDKDGKIDDLNDVLRVSDT
jgi:Ca2+-binding EF-hand superfamily protein